MTIKIEEYHAKWPPSSCVIYQCSVHRNLYTKKQVPKCIMGFYSLGRDMAEPLIPMLFSSSVLMNPDCALYYPTSNTRRSFPVDFSTFEIVYLCSRTGWLLIAADNIFAYINLLTEDAFFELPPVSDENGLEISGLLNLAWWDGEIYQLPAFRSLHGCFWSAPSTPTNVTLVVMTIKCEDNQYRVRVLRYFDETREWIFSDTEAVQNTDLQAPLKDSNGNFIWINHDKGDLYVLMAWDNPTDMSLVSHILGRDFTISCCRYISSVLHNDMPTFLLGSENHYRVCQINYNAGPGENLVTPLYDLGENIFFMVRGRSGFALPPSENLIPNSIYVCPMFETPHCRLLRFVGGQLQEHGRFGDCKHTEPSGTCRCRFAWALGQGEEGEEEEEGEEKVEEKEEVEEEEEDSEDEEEAEVKEDREDDKIENGTGEQEEVLVRKHWKDTLICDTQHWKALKAHVEDIKKTHLRDLMNDNARCESMMIEFDGIFLDYSRQCATIDTMDKLFKLANAAAHLRQKISSMFNGERINSTENRYVPHVALRASKDSIINSGGKNVVPDVWQVLDKIRDFSERVRSGSWVGATGKALKDVIAIGIGGSFLGPLFVHTALQSDPEAIECARGRQLRFLANADPMDVARNMTGLNPETTLVVVVSKTFTTAETMLNATAISEWISSALGPEAVARHMVAVSTKLTLVEKFGIDPNNAFVFWDWVGDRYSVCSAVGVLPLSLQYGFSVIEKFLKGASRIAQHFYSAPLEKNIPVILGLLSVWNVSFLGYPARAILPYSQALEKLAPHIQQVSMESNGKGLSIDGVVLPFEAGEIDFGELGTNGQHSFYQLIHQGRVIPCDFIGVVKSQQPVNLKDEVVNNHDELMSSFFAQPDALAYGKTPEQLQKENVAQNLIPHKTFSGNKPSLSLLLPSLNAYNIGQLLAIYEHRIAVEGFIWGINSVDQCGVELGKSLASQVRKQLHASRKKGEPIEGFNFSTTTLLKRYLEASADVPSDPSTFLQKI